MLLIWRFIVGFSIGAGQPAWLAIQAEISPSYWRICTQGLTQSMFALGDPWFWFSVLRENRKRPTTQDPSDCATASVDLKGKEHLRNSMLHFSS